MASSAGPDAADLLIPELDCSGRIVHTLSCVWSSGQESCPYPAQTFSFPDGKNYQGFAAVWVREALDISRYHYSCTELNPDGSFVEYCNGTQTVETYSSEDGYAYYETGEPDASSPFTRPVVLYGRACVIGQYDMIVDYQPECDLTSWEAINYDEPQPLYFVSQSGFVKTPSFYVCGFALTTPEEELTPDEEGKIKFDFTLASIGDGHGNAYLSLHQPRWKLEVKDAEGQAVWSVSGQSDQGFREIPIEVEWDGKDSEGNTLPAGEYKYYLSAQDGILPGEPGWNSGYSGAYTNNFDHPGTVRLGGEPVLELYDEDEEILLASTDSNLSIDFPSEITIACLTKMPSILSGSRDPEIHFPTKDRYSRLYVFPCNPNSNSTIKVELLNISKMDKAPTILIKTSKSFPENEPVSVPLTWQASSNKYVGSFTVGKYSGAKLPLMNFDKSYIIMESLCPHKTDKTGTHKEYIAKGYNTQAIRTYIQNYHPSPEYTELGFAWGHPGQEVIVNDNGKETTEIFFSNLPDFDNDEICTSLSGLRAAGYETITVTCKPCDQANSLKAKVHIKNQAKELIYLGHGGEKENGITRIYKDPENTEFTTELVPCYRFGNNWVENLHTIILDSCNVLDIGNLNRKNRFYPYYLSSPGKEWDTKVKSGSLLLGYNGQVIFKDETTDIAVLSSYYNNLSKMGGWCAALADNGIPPDEIQQVVPILAWIKANADYPNVSNDQACGIITRRAYYCIKYKKYIYYDKDLKKMYGHKNRCIVRIDQSNWDNVNESTAIPIKNIKLPDKEMLYDNWPEYESNL